MNQDRDWTKRMAVDVGKRVALHRAERQISAQQLADRCAGLGLPALSRIVITRLENGRRDAVSTAEITILAKALGMSPIRLLFPMGLNETVEVLPGIHEDTLEAAAWFSGEGDPDVQLFMMHRALLKRSRGGQGPTPTGIFVGSMTKEEVKRWQQEVLGEQLLRQNRDSIREHGLTPPRLPADLAWLDDPQDQPTMTTTTEEPVTEAATTPEPEPVVAAIVVSPLGVLIGRRNDGKPPWAFISGKIEPGESPADAGVGEGKEEPGLRIAAGHEIGRRVHPATGRTMIYMAAGPVRGTDIFVGDEDELAEVKWASLAEADELLPGLFGPVREYLAQVMPESGDDGPH